MDAKRILRELVMLRLCGSHEQLLWIQDLFVWPASHTFRGAYVREGAACAMCVSHALCACAPSRKLQSRVLPLPTP